MPTTTTVTTVTVTPDPLEIAHTHELGEGTKQFLEQLLERSMALNGELSAKLDELLAAAKTIRKQEHIIMQEIDDLHLQVEANTSVTGSAAALIRGFSARLDAAIAAGTPAEVKASIVAFRDELKTSGDDLAAAVAANTPAPVEPPVDTPPEGV